MDRVQSNEMRNQVQGVNTFWEMRTSASDMRGPIAARRLRPSRSAHGPRRAPRALTPSQVDPVSGKVNWPGALQDPLFADQRGVVDADIAKLVAQGGLDFAEKTRVRESIDTMFDALKDQIRNIPPQEYAASRSFLQSLVYAATRTTLQ